MKIILIAAHDPNLVIGKDGDLPWHYPEDLKFFKKTTMGYPLLMGRIVFESFNENPLPGRESVVLSRTKSYEHVPVFKSIDGALKYLSGQDKIFVIGGGEIYKQTLHMANQLIITEIHKPYKGDTFFPEYRDDIGSVWNEVSREYRGEFSIIKYERI